MISERKQFCVFVGRRPVVQEALYKWYTIVCSSGDVFHVGLHKVLVASCSSGFRRVLAIIRSKSFSRCFFLIVVVTKAVGLMGADHQIQNDHGTSCRPTSNITSNTGPCPAQCCHNESTIFANPWRIITFYTECLCVCVCVMNFIPSVPPVNQ